MFERKRIIGNKGLSTRTVLVILEIVHFCLAKPLFIYMKSQITTVCSVKYIFHVMKSIDERLTFVREFGGTNRQWI